VNRESGFAFDQEFYDRLIAGAGAWRLLDRTVVPAGRGHCTLVRACQAVKLVMLERAQIIDLDVFSASDPTEHLHAPSQLYIEGGRVEVGTRLWSTPPRTRPLATVVADRIEHHDEVLLDHKCYGAHCNPHQWLLFAGFAPRTCYDNLSEGCRMVGLEPRLIHDNLNLYMKAALDPATGRHLNVASDGQAGDYIQFFAETDAYFVLSLCPYGDGSVVPDDWATTPVPTSPVAVEIAATGIEPLSWPSSADTSTGA
jgi:uncharacterized protein YcgI (DUF1989 family)